MHPKPITIERPFHMQSKRNSIRAGQAMAAAAFMILLAKSAIADTWYTVPLSTFSVMTINGGNAIVSLQAPDGLVHTIGSGSNAISASEIRITPPSGRGKEWEGIILSALATGTSIKVRGLAFGAASAPRTVNSPSSSGVTAYLAIMGAQ